jgi:uncharacterized SAM-binding protein YcdF (DUF218 family)
MLRLFGFLFLTAGILLVTATLLLSMSVRWLARSPQVDQVDAVVVLGSGHPQRMLRGISLYKQGLGPELWHTGHTLGPREHMTRAQQAAQLAIAHDVPAEAIRLLASGSTWEDGQAIAAQIKDRQLKSIIVVTDWWHSRRALCVIKQQLAGSRVAVYYAPPPDSPYGPDNWWQERRGRALVFRELVKNGYYWSHYGVVPWRCRC